MSCPKSHFRTFYSYLAVTTVLSGAIKMKILIGDRFLVVSITICRECTHTEMTNIQHSMKKREKALAYERGNPTATDASNQSTTVFYHNFIYLQFCKVGIFIGI